MLVSTIWAILRASVRETMQRVSSHALFVSVAHVITKIAIMGTGGAKNKKKMKARNFFAVLMGLLSGRTMAYDIAAENADGVTIYYRYEKNGSELQVTYGNLAYNSYSGDVVVPETVFYKNRLRRVTSVGNSAFAACEDLRSVSLPQSVQHIGAHAFQSCQRLHSVNIPDSVGTIENYAFSGCSDLTTVTLPDGLTSIGDCLFLSCVKLKSIRLSQELRLIGVSAFQACRHLESIQIPDNVETIARCAFSGCRNLKEVSFGRKVRTIGDYAFAKCENLKKILLPDSISTIGHCAFASCERLKEVVMPDNAVTIGSSAFSGCTGIRRVIFPNLGKLCESKFENIASNPIHITRNLFIGKESINVLSIPKGVCTIGDYAFRGCKNIVRVEMSEDVTSIGTAAFQGCENLRYVQIGKGVRKIKSNAFDCPNLEDIEISADVPIAINGNESNVPVFNQEVCNHATLHVPMGTRDRYKSKRGWWDFIWIKEKK